MIPIHTKKLRKKWFCFSTFDGYDYSYTGKNKEEAQDKMKARLKKSGLEGHGLFLNEEIIPDPPPGSKPQNIWQQRPKIDNNPFA